MKILYLLIGALKLAGILTLILLLLLILLITIILLVPIKYAVDMNKTEKTYAYTNIKWLYSILVVDIIYNSDEDVKKEFKLFGIRIKPKQPKKNKITKEAIAKEDMTKEDQPKKPVIQEKKTAKKADKKVKKAQRPKKSGLKGVISQIQAFEYKMDLLADTAGWIGRFFKSISPETLYIDIEIGKEDPADTGQLMAILSALFPFYYPMINFVGNYEKECLYGSIVFSGKMSVGRFVVDLWKYIRTRSVRELIKFIRKNRKGK